MPRGLYKTLPDRWVRVRYDDGTEMDISEDRYREDGYQPPHENLPVGKDGQKLEATD